MAPSLSGPPSDSPSNRSTRPSSDLTSDLTSDQRLEAAPGGPAFLARIYWMLLGWVPIGAAAAAVERTATRLDWADAAFWASVGGLLGVRFYDITRLGGRTAEDEPATLGHWRRHCAIVLSVAAAAWLALDWISRAG